MLRSEVWLVHLEPTTGSEIRKTRPCVIISPDELNRVLATVIIAPMTTQGKDYPSRVECVFENRSARVVLDQIRTVDKSRLVKKLGPLPPTTVSRVLKFSPRCLRGSRVHR